MHYWLVKSEPSEYSFSDLENEKKCIWNGVRNYAARNHLREMEIGDLVLFYHSREGLEIVGIARVVREAFPDPTAETGDWSAVEMEAVSALPKPVSLRRLKADPAFSDLGLVRFSRLSVSPVSEAHFMSILSMAEAIDNFPQIGD